MTDRRKNILDAASDAGVDFIYYDRKEDEDLPPEQIEQAIEHGEITVTEIIAAFLDGSGLDRFLTTPDPNATT